MKPLILLLILAVNFFRFYGLAWSPPGFFVDEAGGASHAICLQQTGSDFTGKFLPLYSDGPGKGSGKYSAPFVWGEAAWTSLVGTSPAGFRSLMALLTALTCLFIYFWLKKRTNPEIALTGLLLASISPWAFHFSRIAWDPPMAPFFILLGMVLLDADNKRLKFLGPLSFALASYAYPPSRIQVPFLLLFFGGKTFREKGISFIWYLIFLIPMFHATWVDPEYSSRGKLLAIWTYYQKPEDLIRIFSQNFLAHLNPNFLLFKGDPNLRHSIQTSGMMSIPEWLILHLGLILRTVVLFWKKWTSRPVSLNDLTIPLLISAFLGFLPAALTVESIPHALRSIGAWPFFVMTAACWFHRIPKSFNRPAMILLILISTLTTTRYLYHYFMDYPQLAAGSFTLGIGKIDSSFPALSEGLSHCRTLQAK